MECWRAYLIVYSDRSECCVLLGIACMSNATSLCVYFSLLAGLLQLRALTCLSIRFREHRISFELTYLYSFLYSYISAVRQKSWRSLHFNTSPNLSLLLQLRTLTLLSIRIRQHRIMFELTHLYSLRHSYILAVRLKIGRRYVFNTCPNLSLPVLITVLA